MYRQKSRDIAIASGNAKTRLERNINSITRANDEFKSKRRQLIEELEQKARLYLPDELAKRLMKERNEIWYVPILAKGDVTKYEEVRNCKYIDAAQALIMALNAL